VNDRRRYVRQVLVAEIGEAGQARLAGGVAPLSGPGLAHEIAAAYASRAGIGSVVSGPVDVGALAPAFLEEPAARAVVAGSRAALSSLRTALGVR
jgi:hypothetical protein